MTAQCVTMWIGNSLGPVERACLRSVLRQGHPLALYCYSRPAGVPNGVELRDAARILPKENVFLHRRRSLAPFSYWFRRCFSRLRGVSIGSELRDSATAIPDLKLFFHRRPSFAPFSDWFRYELQDLGAGIWLDADVYLVAPLDTGTSYLFGEEAPGMINNAVLRLPEGSEIVRRLLAPIRHKTRPSWMKRSLWHFLQSGRGRDPARLPWGMTGPLGLTAVARELGLTSYAQPPAVFYPARWQDAEWIRNPAIRMEDVITDRTKGIHLWNERINRFKNEPSPKGSFLDRLHQEGAD